MDHAKQLTFNKDVNCRTVTISGEDFRPSGVLTGGSRPNRTAMLLELSSVLEHYSRLDAITDRITQIDGISVDF